MESNLGIFLEILRQIIKVIQEAETKEQILW